jgi:hypothetical protein
MDGGTSSGRSPRRKHKVSLLALDIRGEFQTIPE